MDDLTNIKVSVARIEEGVTGIRGEMKGLREVTVKRLDDHAKRVNSLEQTRDRQRGAAKLSGVLVAFLAAILSWLKWWS